MLKEDVKRWVIMTLLTLAAIALFFAFMSVFPAPESSPDPTLFK
jgi:hypothetical protein